MVDEQIAKLAAAQHKEEHPTGIADGAVKIGECFFSFAQADLLEGRLHIHIPDEFTDMPETMAVLKYPGSARPKVIKSDEKGAVCFTFNLVDSPLSDETVPQLAGEMKTALQRLNPAWLFFGEGALDTQAGGKVGFLEYKSPAIDDMVYNLMFFVPVGGNTMIGAFSCPYDEYAQWRPAIAETLQMIRVTEEEGYNA